MSNYLHEHSREAGKGERRLWARGREGAKKEYRGREGCCVHWQTRNTCAILLKVRACVCVRIVQARKKSSLFDSTTRFCESARSKRWDRHLLKSILHPFRCIFIVNILWTFQVHRSVQFYRKLWRFEKKTSVECSLKRFLFIYILKISCLAIRMWEKHLRNI